MNDKELEAQIRARDRRFGDFDDKYGSNQDRRTLLRLLDEARAKKHRLVEGYDAAIDEYVSARDAARTELADAAAAH